jgi:hypothetical protein
MVKYHAPGGARNSRRAAPRRRLRSRGVILQRLGRRFHPVPSFEIRATAVGGWRRHL